MGHSIAMLIDGNEGFGVRTAVLSLIRGLTAHACRIHVISLSQGAFAAELAESGVSLKVLSCGRLPSLSGNLISKARQLGQLARLLPRARKVLIEELNRCRADLLHVVWPLHIALAGPASKHVGIRCFWEMSNVISSYPLALNRFCYQLVSYRYSIVPLANSRYTATSLGRLLVNPHVVYLGADAQRFRPRPPGDLRARLGIEDAAAVFGVFARPDPNKGQRLLIEAMHDFLTTGGVHLVLVGGSSADPYVQQLRAAAGRHPGRVHFLTTTQHPESLMADVDVVISCGIHAEAFGYSVVEGLLCGKPVLAHALGGPAETVIDGITGWHISAPSHAEFKSGIARALQDRPRWRAMGEAARVRGLEFSTEAHARRYMDLVQAYLPWRRG